MARDALRVEDRLDEAREREGVRARGLRLDARRSTPQGDRRRDLPGHRRARLPLVAADARERLARVEIRGRTHRVDGEAVLVNCLEVDAAARRHREVRAPVFLDGHRPVHAPPERLLRAADVRRVLQDVRLREDVDDPKLLDDRALRPREFALVDVRNHHRARRGSWRAGRPVGHRLRGPRREDGRPHAGRERDGVEACEFGIAVDELAVAEAIHKEYPVVLLPGIVYAKIIILIQRPRVPEDLRARIVPALPVRAAR